MLSFEVKNFYQSFTVYIISQKIVSPKRLKLERIVALTIEDLRYVLLDFQISIDPQITVDPGKVPQNNKHRHPNKHKPWKI